jgi:hypothetical protein
MAQTIWIHRLADTRRKEADGMDFVCEHLFQQMTDKGKFIKQDGWSAVENAEAKDGATYRSLFCDMCAKNYHRSGHVRLAKEPVLA